MSVPLPSRDEMLGAARALWGPENLALSKGDEIRWGSKGSKALDLGKRVWHDHETNDGGGFVELFKLAGIPLPNGRDGAAAPTATYDYTDEEQRLLFQVVRFPGHKFRQRRPDGTGEWIWKLDKVRRVPYRLPELLASDPARRVFVAEGEKDVNNLCALGLAATCNPGGAGKWRREYGEHLRDRDVVVLPDNDDAGHAHARDVAAKLSGIARSVGILELPNLPPKGDVSDWLAAGGSADQLLALTEKLPRDDQTEVTDADTEKEIARLAKLSAVRYARERDAAARLLKLPPAVVDRLVKGEHRENGNGRLQGRPLDLTPPEPWPTPVDGVQLFAELVEFFSEHAKLLERGAVMLSLWVVHTYAYLLWRYTPRLHITGPTKRCGKSRVLRLVGLLVCKPVPSSAISAPAVYRSIEAAHPTLLIDEADLSVKNKPELLTVLNGGYERGQNVVLTVGEDHEPRLFDLFAPVALAGIGRLAGQLEDRSIRLPMRRALPTEKPKKISQASETRGERLQRQVARWVTDNYQALATAAPDVSHLPDRVDDHWLPLYAVASVVEDNWPQLVAAAQQALTPADHDTDSLGEKLIRDIRALWVEKKKPTTGEIGSTALVDHLTGSPSGEWLELGRLRKPLTTTRLASLLKGFEAAPKRNQTTNNACYDWRDIVPLFERYA